MQGGAGYLPLANYPLYDPGAFEDSTLPPLILHPLHYDLRVTAAPDPHSNEAYIPQLQYPVQPPPIHAPTPIAAYAPLLADQASSYTTLISPYSSPSLPVLAAPPSPPATVVPEAAPRIIRLSPAPETPEVQLAKTPEQAGGRRPRDTLAQYNAPQVLFPTPSELLTDPDRKQGEPATSPPPDVGGSSSRRSSRREAKESQAKGKGKARASSVGESSKSENLRKSYFRSVADKVGFESTDPYVPSRIFIVVCDAHSNVSGIRLHHTTRSGTTSSASSSTSFGCTSSSGSRLSCPNRCRVSTIIAV